MSRKPSPRKDYYADWYQNNKDRISEKRKVSYDSDPDYKKKVLAQSAEHRERQREAPRAKVPRHTVPRTHTAGDGGKVTLFSIGFFSIFIGRSVQSINDWERRNILPRTPYVGPPRVKGKGFRYYTESMMVVVKEFVGNKRRLYPVDDKMGSKISRLWVQSGVPMKREYESLKNALKATKTEDVKVFRLEEE